MVVENPSLGEENEKNNNKKSNENFDFKGPMNEFIGKKVEGNALYFKGKKKDDIWIDFIEFLEKSDIYDVESIKKFQDGKDTKYFNYLLNEVNNETIPLESLYNGVLKLFDKTYQFEEKERKKLEQELLKQGRGDLAYLQYGDARRVKFLKTIGLKPKTRDEIKDNDEMFSAIFGSLDESLKDDKEFVASLAKFYNGNYLVEVNDLQTILDKLNDKNKLSLIQYFIPRISLKDALKYGLLTEEKVENYIQGKLTEDLTPEQQKKFISQCDYSDFFIETNDENLNLSEILNKLDKFNNLLQKAVSEYKQSILESKSGIKFVSFEDLKDQAVNAGIVPKEFEEIFKAKDENYFEIKTKKEGENEKSTFFKIAGIDEDNEKITILNVTTSTGGITKNDKSIHTDIVSFEDFFAMLSGISQSNGTKQISFFEDSQKLQKKANVKEEYLLGKEFDNQEIATKEDLKLFLDQVDSKNSGVDFDKMAFKCKPNAKNPGLKYLMEDEVYTVQKIENGQVFLVGQKPMSFSDFALTFADRKCERFTKIDNPNDFFEALKNHDNLKDGLKDFEFHDGKIVNKSEHDGKNAVKYLVASDGEALMIDELGSLGMDFATGEYTEEEDKKTNTITNTFDGTKGGKGSNFDYSTMFLYLTSKKFTPIYKKNVEEHHDEHGHGEHLHKHTSFFKAWMSCLSVSEIGAGFHHIQHTIEHKLKFGSDLKAARLARKMGKILPKGLLYELESVVEQEESKNMEAKIKELKGMSTWKMIEEVEHILAVAKPYDPELEAALFAVVGKTGLLYPKGLKKYKGSFMWYEALGGKVGDKIYMEFKKECEDSVRLPFNEEYLIERLLDHQTDKLNTRRNKFNKQYGNVLKDGMKEEEEDGVRKTKNKTTAKGRLDYILSEFGNLTYWNGIGAIDNLISKGPDPGHVFGGLPFVILTSGMSMDFLPEMVNKVRAYSMTTPVFTSLTLISDKTNLEIYNNYVAKTIELSEPKGKDSEIYKDFKKISHGSREENIEKAKDFWYKYGKELYPKINMSDGFVVANKDDKGKEELARYYDSIKTVHDDSEFKAEVSTKHIDIGFVDQVNSPIAATGGLLSKIKTDTNGNLDTTGKRLTIMYLEQLLAVMDNNSIKDDKKKEVFKMYYKMIERQLSISIGRDNTNDYKKYPFYQDIIKYNKWFELFPNKYTDYKNELSPDSKAYDEMLDKKWNDYKNGGNKDEVKDEVEGVKKISASVLDIGNS